MKRIAAFTFFRTPAPGVVPEFVTSEFVAADGQLEHYTEGRLRAVVPPEGLDDYARQWPDCAPVVEEIKRTPKVAQVLFVGEEATRMQTEKALAELGALEGGAK